MISGLSLKRFKAFKSLEFMNIKKLTVLLGKNSCGKSSILQSLLLLKQSINNDIVDDALILDGQYLQYSSLREITFGLPQDATASIEYTIFLKDRKNNNQSLTFEFRYKKQKKESLKKSVVVNKFQWRNENNINRLTLQLLKYKYKYPISNKAFTIPSYVFEDEEIKNSNSNRSPEVTFENFLPKYVSFDVKHMNEERVIGYYPFGRTNKDYSLLIRDFINDIKNIKYLGPVRATPKRAYIHYSESNYDLLDDGSNAAHIFWMKKDNLIRFNGKNIKLYEAVNQCFKMLGLSQNIEPYRHSKFVYQIKLDTPFKAKKKNKSVTIVDVGFGYSQLLPIILRGLLSENNALLLFEQPEIHLHPSSCANLADLFIKFIESGKRLLIETHSTELINRLRLRVIENPDLQELINICFVEPMIDNNKGAMLTELNLNNEGMFDKWPDGFCDESAKTAQAILKARINKGKRNE